MIWQFHFTPALDMQLFKYINCLGADWNDADSLSIPHKFRSWPSLPHPDQNFHSAGLFLSELTLWHFRQKIHR